MEDVGGGDEVEAEAEDEVGAAVVVEAEVIREVVQQDKTIVGRILLHHLRKMLLHSQNKFNNVRKLALEWRRKVRVGWVDSTCHEICYGSIIVTARVLDDRCKRKKL